MSNKPTVEQRRRWEILRAFGCFICGTPAEIHHCGIVVGCKKDHDKVISLCAAHHRSGGYGVAIHSGRKEWERNFAPEQSFLEMADRIMEKNK